MDTPDKTTEASDLLQVLKAIHAEQQRQGKHLRNIYQIQLIMFAAILVGVTVTVINQLK